MLIWAVSSFLQIFCQHVLLAQNSVCVLSLGYEFVARRCKTYKELEWLQLNPLFWPVSQTVLSCTHAAVRAFFFHRRQYDNRATVVEWTNSFVSLCMCRMNWHLFFRFQFNSHYSIIFDSLKVFLCYVLPVKSGVPRVLSPTSHTTVFFASNKKSLNQDETQMQNQFFQSNSQLDSIEITIVKRNVWQIRILIFICRSICFQLAQMYPELVSRVILSSLLNKRAFSSALTTKALFLSWSGFIFLRVPFDSNGCVCVCLCTFGKMLAEWFSHHKRWAHFSFHARIICVYYIDSNGLIIYMAD